MLMPRYSGSVQPNRTAHARIGNAPNPSERSVLGAGSLALIASLALALATCFLFSPSMGKADSSLPAQVPSNQAPEGTQAPPEETYVPEEVRSETASPKPWEFDPAPAEAAAKIAFHERMEEGMERWVAEPTPNQLALDAQYYDLSLDIDPDSQWISGILLARFRVDAAEADVADLSLADALTVTAVTMGGSPVMWTHAGEILSVTLDQTYYHDELVELAIHYEGTPPGAYGAFGFSSHSGEPMIWTLSEPFGARSWWPCDDWSDDKADSIDLRITVPTGLIVASNGELRDVTYGGETDTYWWHEGYPIATYLVSLAIHPYTVYFDYYHYSPSDSMEIRFFIYPDHVDDSYEDNMMTSGMVEFFASIYGEYPFLDEKYGHAEFNWSGGMEHQTCTSLGVFFETIIAHELAHQWWGDMVTCADFHHIWLNEGFAVYSEALWLDHNYGAEGYWGKMNATRYYGGGTIYVPDLSDWGRIFHTGLSYNKASWVLHMLRHVIGDDAFFQMLADYRAAFEYGAARTEDLQAIAEAVSGRDLSDFFHQWIYEEYFPQYAYSWDCVQVREQYELQLSIDQIQTNTTLFHMPIDIRVELEGGGTDDFVVDNRLAHEEYVLPLSAPAVAVYLDPDNWILKRVQEEVVDPTFDAGILLVNGVEWSTYGSEIFNAYEARAFWGNLEISFWDCFPEPAGGYPSTLPAPLGRGRVPATTLGSFETVIWVGNNYNGDLAYWWDTSILPYLEAGGNVLLMTRQGDTFLDEPLRAYLGITIGNGTNLYDCISVHELLTDIARTGTQSYCMVFEPELIHETSTLLYVADSGYDPDMGIGVWRAPTGGGTYNPDGAQFAFLSGRPYRWDHAGLRTNVETIISVLFAQGGTGVEDLQTRDTAPLRLTIRFANPSTGTSRVEFWLPRHGPAELTVHDIQGRLIRRLTSGTLDAGKHSALWNGRTAGGAELPSGVYYLRLHSESEVRCAPLLLVR